MTVSITEFITARLEEDEAAATEAGGDEWTSDVHVWMVVDSTGDPVAYDEGRPTEEQAAHIARYDPARVLREVEAKRHILADHSTPHTVVDGFCTECGREVDKNHHGGDWCSWHGDHACPTVRSLAAAWSDHEDYNPDWSAT